MDIALLKTTDDPFFWEGAGGHRGESGRVLTALMTVDTDDLPQGDGQGVVPVDAVPGHNAGHLKSKSGGLYWFLCDGWVFFYLFSRSQSPSVPLMSWLGVHFRVRLSPAWWRDK